MNFIMNEKQRDKILKLTRAFYEAQGCVFPSDNREMIEYIYDSNHPAETGCLELSIQAHNIYCDGDLDLNSFFEWHGL